MRRYDSSKFYHFDGLGSTERLTYSNQNTVVSYLYRAFGEQSVVSGSSANPFTWVGRLGYYRQPDTDNYWLRARVHQPGIGRFLSLDPLRQEVNRYLYAKNRPLVMVDASGRECQGPGYTSHAAGGMRMTCVWEPATRPAERPGRGQWCCPCSGEKGEEWACMVPRIREGRLNAPAGHWETQVRAVESYHVRCDCGEGPRVVGKECRVDFRVTRVSQPRHPTWWRDAQGELARRRQCRPVPVWGPFGGGGGPYGNGGGGEWVGGGATKGKILFFAGGFGDNPENPSDPKRLNVLAGYRLAVKYLRDAGYDAEIVGGYWAHLRRANEEPHLLGLIAMGHGNCTARSTGDVCLLRTLNRFHDVQYLMFYHVSANGEIYNDWRKLRGISTHTFRLLSVCHCVSSPFANHTDTIEQWLATAIGQDVRKVSFCDVLPNGNADDDEYSAALNSFLDHFLKES